MRVVRIRGRPLAHDQDRHEWSGRRRRGIQCDGESGSADASRCHQREWAANGDYPVSWHLPNRSGTERRELQSGRWQRSGGGSCIESDVPMDRLCGRRVDSDPNAQWTGERNCLVRGRPVGDANAQLHHHNRGTEVQRDAIRRLRLCHCPDLRERAVSGINGQGRSNSRTWLQLDGHESSAVADDCRRRHRER